MQGRGARNSARPLQECFEVQRIAGAGQEEQLSEANVAEGVVVVIAGSLAEQPCSLQEVVLMAHSYALTPD